MEIIEFVEPPIAVGDVQDFDADFTQYVTGMGEAVDGAHVMDLCETTGTITLGPTPAAIYNGQDLPVLDDEGQPTAVMVSSCFVKVWVTATQAGTFEIVVRIATAGQRKHTVVLKIKVKEA